MSRLCLYAVLCVVAVGYVHCNVIGPSDEGKPPSPNTLVEDVQVTPDETIPKCKKIGEFCMNHGDCCTNSCLGYLKRCVS